MLGVGYAFDWGDLVTVWRYLDCNMSSGHAVEKMKPHAGPGAIELSLAAVRANSAASGATVGSCTNQSHP